MESLSKQPEKPEASPQAGWSYFRPTGFRGKLVSIPVIFGLLLVGTLFYTMTTLWERQTGDWLVHAYGRQMRLAELYVPEVLLASHGYPSPYRDTFRMLEDNTRELSAGGKILFSRWLMRRVDVPPPADGEMNDRMTEQKVLINRLKAASDRLLRISPSDRRYNGYVHEVSMLGERMSSLSALSAYDLLEQNRQATQRLIWIEVLISLAAVALGIVLTRQVAQGNKAIQKESRDRLAAEKAMKTSEQRFRSLFETANDAIFLADKDLNIVLFNHVTAELFGYNEAELLGVSLASLIPAADLQAHLGLIKSSKAFTGENYADRRFETTGIRKSGELFSLELSLAAWDVDADSDGHCYTVIARDISARKMAEEKLLELSKSNEELEHYTLVASHDLQEPLRKVLVYSDMLKVNYAEEISADALRYIDNIQDSSRRMQQLISALLTYSRITTQGRQFAEVDLNDVASQAIADLEWPIEDSQAQIELGPLPVIDADAVQMRQLFQNLLSNALKYSKAGIAPEVKISCRLLESEELEGLFPEQSKGVDCYCQIAVRDNGIGFDEKYLDRIFKVFQRLHGRKEYYGTGIGLAICRKIVERHGGFITARSRPGEGALFMVTLPTRRQAADSHETLERFQARV